MTEPPTPRTLLLRAATAIALWRGGMEVCTDLVMRLREGLDAMGAGPQDDLGGIAAAAQAVVEARCEADVVAFDAARCRLWAEVARYWSGQALGGRL
ncbi:hypothetical protein [Salipiger abyssi]|uniref:hypothetical protein n=1 Tax=Salipiger abyssi TaxID=1250539 RepID=UPI004059B73C